MNKTELQTELATLLKRVVDLETKIEEMPDEVVGCMPIIERTDKYTSVNSYFSTQTDTDRGYVNDNLRYENYNYYPADGELCEQVADYLKHTHLFTRKAIEFAQGYKFKTGGLNKYVYYCRHEKNKFSTGVNTYVEHPEVVYMTETQAKKFADWCNEHRKELGYD